MATQQDEAIPTLRAGLVVTGTLMLVAAFMPAIYANGKLAPGSTGESVVQFLMSFGALSSNPETMVLLLIAGVGLLSILLFGALSIVNGLLAYNRKRFRIQRFLIVPTLMILGLALVFVVLLFLEEKSLSSFWRVISSVTGIWALVLPLTYIAARWFFLQLRSRLSLEAWKNRSSRRSSRRKASYPESG